MNWKTLACTTLLLIGAGFSAVSNGQANDQSMGDTAIWIDVRSQMEHSLDSIEGDVRISHGDIVKEVGQLFSDKNTEIYLYCRSGGRAGKAMSALRAAGYRNVSNVGSIEAARKERGLSE